ncbi:ABC transporter permease [Acrocarpospora sp. B8E8]|uniref:ABC transporter permease n=1 Tax=Acrocarpospora sp. B8E8 TaxID=3153572 RepID=UPI00325EFF1B
MKREIHAEWTKLRTLAGTGWVLLAIPVLTVALGAAAGAATTCASARCNHDVVKLALTGVQLSQVVVAVLAVLAITGEHTTGLIRTTFTAMPRRFTVLGAKAAVLAGPTLVAAIAGVLGSVLAGRLILPGRGFTPAHGYPLLSLTDGLVLRAAAGSVLYLTLIAVLCLGVAAIVRDSAAAMGVVLGLFYLFPILIHLVSDPDWQRLLFRISPTNAGLAIQSSMNLDLLPIGPWPGLGVLAAWAAAALLAGGLLVRLRDV